jgi:hypothetical protein
MKRLTISLEEDLYELLHNRSNYNRRSMNKEIVFLLEAALSMENEGNLNILRTMMMAQGGLDSVRIEMDEHQLAS